MGSNTISNTSGISSTPVVPLGPITTTSYGTRVIYASNGQPVQTTSQVVAENRGPRDSENRLYVLKDDYISRDNEPFRRVTFPIDPRAFLFAGRDDGIVPRADPMPKHVYNRVIKETGGGWPAGRIIEDRSKYGPTGALAVDTIPASVVPTPPVVTSKQDSLVVPVAAAIGIGAMLAIAMFLENASSNRKK